MANESIRIRTTPGIDKNIRIKLDQDFDFLEVLSLKISQEDTYQPFCSNYGAVVGRVIANKGFGLPNVKVSIFIPITSEDEKNSLIKDLYPFKTPATKNSDGVRYNLLLSKPTCVLNKPVGTFPSKEEVLDNDIVLEVFDKYYKYTTKTNYAGDYMLFGVPVGQHTIHMDLDMSDIGAASVRPYDLISEGYPEKLFASKTEFKTSTNLDSLPQIKTGNKGIEVVPFWGDSESCEIGITRLDFDPGIEIKPTALFFGSIFTDSGKMNLNKGCNPRNDMGEQDNFRTGEGQITMVRAKEINPNDWADNNTITPTSLEEFSIEGGELIDKDGTFAFPVPMNIGHVITDEFGVMVPSADPSIGIPTKGMYRFKMNFTEPNENPKFRTANLIFPSLGRDFGGSIGKVGGSGVAGTEDQRFTDDLSAYNPNEITKEFHTFEWKQLYSIAHYIKKYKKGGNRFSFLGVKNTDVSSETNLFPFTNAIWKFDILYYIMAFLVEIIALFIKLLIIILTLCIGFCIYISVDVPALGVTILKSTYNVTNGFNILRIDFCKGACPFSGLIGLLPLLDGGGRGFHLPAEDCGPNGDGYDVNLSGSNTDVCTSSTATTLLGTFPCGGGTNTMSIGVGYTVNNSALNTLKEWVCCVKLNLAESRNVIRRVFIDSWVIGTGYLFQFKYKKKKNGKEKFCGPGSDHLRGDNYKNQKCCLDDSFGDCNRCLLRGPNTTQPHNQFSSYHQSYHNSTTNTGETGATDINDIIYCNALMSTKIVSLGRIEMCEETLEDIELSILAAQALKKYKQSNDYWTGTHYETGWDVDYWVKYLKESSYNDPREILQFLAKLNDCDIDGMFFKGALLSGNACHEFELKDDNYFFMKEVSKIYNDVETYNNPTLGDIVYNGTSPTVSNPFADTVNSDVPLEPTYGGLEVISDVANRFSPCGNNGQCGPILNNWSSPSFGIPNEDLSNNPNAFDKITSRQQRNNINTQSNVPYYYFGINPGKTAINRLKKDYFVEK